MPHLRGSCYQLYKIVQALEMFYFSIWITWEFTA